MPFKHHLLLHTAGVAVKARLAITPRGGLCAALEARAAAAVAAPAAAAGSVGAAGSCLAAGGGPAGAAPALEDAACRETAAFLGQVHAAWAHAVAYLAPYAPEPRSVCRLHVAFQSAILGWALPSVAAHVCERWARAAYLRERGLSPTVRVMWPDATHTAVAACLGVACLYVLLAQLL